MEDNLEEIKDPIKSQGDNSGNNTENNNAANNNVPIASSWEEMLKEKYKVNSEEELWALIEKPAVVEEKTIFIPQESEFSLMDKYTKETGFTPLETRQMFREEGAWEAVEKAYTPVEDLSALAKESPKDFWERYYINEEKLSISKAKERAELKEIEAEENTPEFQRDLRAAVSKLKATETAMFERFTTIPNIEKQQKATDITPISYSEDEKTLYRNALQESDFLKGLFKEVGLDIEYNFKSQENIDYINNLLDFSEKSGAAIVGDGIDENGNPIKNLLMKDFYENILLRMNLPNIIKKIVEISGADTAKEIKDNLGVGVSPQGKQNQHRSPTKEEAEENQRKANAIDAELAKQQTF